MLGAVWGPGDALVNEIGWVSVFTCEDCFRCGSLWGSTVMKGDGQPEGCGHLRWVVVWDGAFHLLPLPPPECLLSETGWGDDEFLNTLTGLLTWQEGYIQTLTAEWIPWRDSCEERLCEEGSRLCLSFSSAKHQPGSAAAQFPWDNAGVPHGDDPGTVTPSHWAASLRTLRHPRSVTVL